MNVFRVKCPLATLAFGAALLSGIAHAEAAPVDLSPPVRPAGPIEPQTAPSVRTDPIIGTETVPVFGGAVQAETLGLVDPDVAGALREEDGGFGPAMW